LRIAVWDATWDSLTTQTYSFPSDGGEVTGGGWYSAGGADWVVADGWIEITDRADETVSGRYEVTTDEGEVVDESFEDVPYCDTDPLCG